MRSIGYETMESMVSMKIYKNENMGRMAFSSILLLIISEKHSEVHRKLSNIGLAEKNSSCEVARNFFTAIWRVWGHAPPKIVQNIALRLAETAFPRDLSKYLLSHSRSFPKHFELWRG